MTLNKTEHLMLRALARVNAESSSKKCVVTLRYALLWSRSWTPEIENALCNGGDEEPLVAEYYGALCRLALETPFADGAGNLSLPAGPRYTECWITPAGFEYLGKTAES